MYGTDWPGSATEPGRSHGRLHTRVMILTQSQVIRELADESVTTGTKGLFVPSDPFRLWLRQLATNRPFPLRNRLLGRTNSSDWIV